MPHNLDQELRRQARQEPTPDPSALLTKLGPELRRSAQNQPASALSWRLLIPIAAAAALLLFCLRPATPQALPQPLQIAALTPATEDALTQLHELSFDRLFSRGEELPQAALKQQMQLLRQDFGSFLPAGSQALLSSLH